MIRTIKLLSLALIFPVIISCKKDSPANVAPTVSISAPADNVVLSTPASVTLTANGEITGNL